MSFSPKKQTIGKSWFSATILFLYPFSVLFSPLINFGVIHARLDELAILLYIPVILADWRKSRDASQALTFKIIMPYAILALLFCWGILLGDNFGSVTISYLRQYTLRPLYLIFIIFVVNNILRRTGINKNIIFVSLLSSLCLAGLLGFLAMKNTGLSTLLIRLYNPHLEFNKYLSSAFNMSVRAMSVFTGYEQASVTYGFGLVMAMAMILFLNKKTNYKLFALGSIAVLLLSILSSARTGLVSIAGGGSLLLFLPARNKGGSKLFLILIGLAFIFSWSAIFTLFPTDETSRRFDDLLNLFDANRSNNVLQRSNGISGLIETQVLAPVYPHGFDMVFGFGDDTKFISDIAYVSFFVKYGFMGLLVVVYFFFRWVSIGIRMINYGLRKGLKPDLMISFYLLPCFAIFFALAATKGHFYFLSLKTGELVSVYLGLLLFEYQSIISHEKRDSTRFQQA